MNDGGVDIVGVVGDECGVLGYVFDFFGGCGVGCVVRVRCS